MAPDILPDDDQRPVDVEEPGRVQAARRLEGGLPQAIGSG